ncbi:hypothetical protein [Nesterenkonia muleiensis]|uniref:hypothetical protein n=1 Tax=Nesterenkonia muleiensis TaxID=2282648 RepID=UPI000E739B38|nr:hypothetical protein [Nesterenkonia muleiensis]
MSEKEWIVTVDDQDLHRLDEIVAELESAGLEVIRVLRSLGQVTGRTQTKDAVGGSAAEDSAPEPLAAVSGVVSVDAVQQYSIKPPDAEVQ